MEYWTSVRTALLQTPECAAGKVTSLDVSIEVLLKSSPIVEEPEAIQLLAIICCLPDGLQRWQEKLDSMMTGFQNVEQVVSALLKSALVSIEINSLKVLSPIRHYMLSRHPAQTQHVEALEKYYCNLVNDYVTASHGSALVHAIPILQSEMGNITQILKLALNKQATKELISICYKLSTYMYKTYGSTDLIHEALQYLDILDMSEIRPKYLQLFGDILQQQCNYEEAIEKLDQAQQQFIQIGDALGAAQCLQGLGEILQMQNKYEDAAEKLNQAQHQFIQMGDAVGLAQCLHRLGNILKLQTKYDKAIEKLSLAQQQFIQLGDSPAAAQCLHSLGEILHMQNKYEETLEKLPSTQHPDSLVAMTNLASTYQEQGKWKEAEDLQVIVKEMRKKVLGAKHPDSLKAIASLASTFQKQHKWKDAEDLQVIVVETSKQMLGTEHPDSLIAMDKLPSTFHAQGRQKAVEELQVVPRKQVLGTEHPDTLKAITDFTSTYMQGQHENAQLPSSLTPHINVVVPQLALDHAATCMNDIKNALAFVGNGTSNREFYVQAGFNEDMLSLGHGIQQEIYIHINFDVSDKSGIVLDELGKHLSPFPSTLFTPTTSHLIPLLSREGHTLDEQEIWNLWEANKVFVQGLHSCHSIPSQETATQVITKECTNGHHGSSQDDGIPAESVLDSKGHGNFGGSGNGKGGYSNGDDDTGLPGLSCSDGDSNNAEFSSGGGFNGNHNCSNPRSGSNSRSGYRGGHTDGRGGGHGDSRFEVHGDEPGSTLSIPFTSSIEVGWDVNPQISQTFTMTSKVNMMVKVFQLLSHFILIDLDVFRCKTMVIHIPPAPSPNFNFSWHGGPYFEVQFSDLSIDTEKGHKTGCQYFPHFTAVHIITSQHATSFLGSSPKTTPGARKTSTSGATTSHLTGEIQMGLQPPVRNTASHSKESGASEVKNRLKIIANHKVQGSPQNNRFMRWAYKVDDDTTTTMRLTVSPAPHVKLGFEDMKPHLEIEMLTVWSIPIGRSGQEPGLAQLLPLKNTKSIPSFANFIQQATMSLPLENLKGGCRTSDPIAHVDNERHHY